MESGQTEGKTAEEQPVFIEAVGLIKRFAEVTAVDGVSFAVQRGELFGFLGPNGAGKTTTINILTGLARPDAGEVRVGGLDCSGNPKAAQHLVGVVPDESNLYPELSGFDNLCFCGALYGMRKDERRARARELLETFGLQEAGKRKFAGYSRGMKRRLTIAAGIIHNPAVLFLDEPTTGIDVASARHIRQLIANLHRAGTTIFLTTHYIEEAERLCERVAFIVRGKIVGVDTVANLLQPVRAEHVMEVSGVGLDPAFSGILASAFPLFAFQSLAEGTIRIVSPEPISIGPLVRFLEDRGIELREARLVHLSLEDVFVRVTGIESHAMTKEKERMAREA
ncbi:MAG: ABC transporter ATP-binding protein [Geobacter sp.]|nr:MAG: ABC transporter ATP-binding protein [Geobacter sp.]